MYPSLFTTPGLAHFAGMLDDERQQQIAKFGDQRHPDGTGTAEQQKYAETARRWCQDAFGSGYGTWADILDEEVAEAKAERDPSKLRAELVQVAAVCAAWISDIDRRPGARLTDEQVAHARAILPPGTRISSTSLTNAAPAAADPTPWPFTLDDPVRAVHFASEPECPYSDPSRCPEEATARRVIKAYRTWAAAHPHAADSQP